MRLHPTIAFTLFAALLAAATLPTGQLARQTENFSVLSGATPLASGEEMLRLQHVFQHQNGVDGSYPMNIHRGGGCAAAYHWACRPHPPKTWFPLADRPTTACGVFLNYYISDYRKACKSEMDWNFDISLSAPFTNLGLVGNLLKPINAEVTPDESLFRTLSWFPMKDPADSSLQGKNLCVTGPHVRDANHSDGREIHPAQVIWWEGEPGDQRADKTSFRHYLFALQDDSGRFDDRNDFDCDGIGGNLPAGFTPWARAPIAVTFKIAFIINPPRSPLASLIFSPMRVRVAERRKRLVVTSGRPERADADDGVNHALVYDGRKLVLVEEAQPADDDVGVRFVEVRKREDGRVQGYVQLSTTIGDNNAADKGGYHLLTADVTNSSGVAGPITGGTIVTTEPCVEERRNLTALRQQLDAALRRLRQLRTEAGQAHGAERQALLLDIRETEAEVQGLRRSIPGAEQALAACVRGNG